MALHAGGTQACCLPDGSCFNSTSCSNCMSSVEGGIACFSDVECSSDPCPGPVGACCSYPDFTCNESVPRDYCTEDFYEGMSCETADCFGPTGSCCVAGKCTSDVFEDQCAGRWEEGGVCTPDPCALPANDTCETATALEIGGSALISIETPMRIPLRVVTRARRPMPVFGSVSSATARRSRRPRAIPAPRLTPGFRFSVNAADPYPASRQMTIRTNRGATYRAGSITNQRLPGAPGREQSTMLLLVGMTNSASGPLS